MAEIANLLTPALVIALFAWLRSDIRKLHDRLDATAKGMKRWSTTASTQSRGISTTASTQSRRISTTASTRPRRASTSASTTSIRDIHDRLDKRFDAVLREIGDLRERMAKMEGSLEGFLAGRRDRDAA